MSAIKQGYKQTKVGIIPQDWEVVKLGKIGDLIGGGTPSTKNEEFWNGNIPWISSSDLNENNIYDISISRFINEQAIKNSATKLIPNKSILIVSRVGVGKIAINNKPLCTSQDFQSLILKKDNHIFLAYKIKNEIQKLIACNQGTSIKGFVKEDLSNLQIPLPPLKEQEKIAEILTTWDEAITKQTELLEAKELQKKALMQKLLSGEIRFSEFTDKWKLFSLNEVLKERKTYQSKGLELEHVSLTKEGVVPKSERYERDFLVKGEDKQYKITKLNDICYNPANLKFGVICKNTYGNGIFSPIYVTFETKKGFNIDFLGYFLTWSGFINKVRRFEEGTVYERMAVNPKDFISFKTKLPSLPEQQKIAEVLSLADDEINLLKNELEELKQQKKALMQKLLTGQVRVKV